MLINMSLHRLNMFVLSLYIIFWQTYFAIARSNYFLKVGLYQFFSTKPIVQVVTQYVDKGVFPSVG